MRPESPRHGFSATEVMVAVMVAATIGIPLLTLLFQERDSEQRSRFEYLAILAARDAAYTARALVASRKTLQEVNQAPTALTGHPLAAFNFNPSDIPTEYSADQKRITVEVKLDNPATPDARVVTGVVIARWVDPELAKSEKRRTSVEFSFGLTRPPGAP